MELKIRSKSYNIEQPDHLKLAICLSALEYEGIKPPSVVDQLELINEKFNHSFSLEQFSTFVGLNRFPQDFEKRN
jgi:hypothetical protein